MNNPARNVPGWLISALLVLVTVAVYWPVRHFDFVNFDDPLYVSRNGWVADGLSVPSVRWAFTAAHASNWHPVTWLSHMLDCQLFGLDAGKHHLTNLVFHAANTVLLFALLQLMTGARWRSAFVAGLFALHPLHVESVAWIAERKDVLSAFFGLLTLIAYAKYARSAQPRLPPNAKRQTASARATARTQTPKHPDSETFNIQHPTSNIQFRNTPIIQRAAWWYTLTLVFFALGLMSKPMLVTWPCVMLLLDFWPLNRIPSFAFRIPSAKDPVQSPGSRIAPAPCPPFLDTLKRLLWEKIPFVALTVISSVITFVVQAQSGAVAPLDRIPLVSRFFNAVMAYATYLVKTFWPVDLAILYLPPEKSSLELAIATLLGLVIVTVGVVLLARRLPYLPTGWFWFGGTLVPVIGLVQVGSQALADRYTYIPLIGIFIILAWGGWDLIQRWARARMLAAVLVLSTLTACAALTARQVPHWQNSETLFHHCLRVTKDNFVIHNHLGSAYFMEGRTDDALKHYRESLRLRPDYSDALNNMGALLTQLGKIEEAMWYLEEAVRRAPKFADTYGKLGLALAASGRHEEAIRYYRQAIALRPDLVEALNNLAWLLATHPEDRLRDGAEAVRLAERACELSGFNETIYIGTLAAAYAEAGRFEEAVTTASRAEAQARKKRQTALAERNAQLRDLYRTGQPYRDPPIAPGP